MAKKEIADQIIEFIEEHRNKVNRENFAVIEFVIQGGDLDGMRIKEFIKNSKKKND